jgi:PrgI family protein
VRSVRIPADVDREDRLLAGLTARQLGWLSAGALVLAGAWSATQSLMPLPVFAVGAAPVAAVFAALALGRHHGLPGDRLALAWARHASSARHLVPAPDGIPALPAWAPKSPPPAPLSFPVRAVAEGGVVDLGEDGLALVCRASSLNFGLRTPEEQEALVAAFGRWLNSLDAPVQVVVRAERVDVAAAVAALRAGAAGLPHPALEAAAGEHAAFLADLAAARDVLRRVVLLVFRQASGDGAQDLLRRRVEEAARALIAAGVGVAALPEDEALAALSRAGDPEVPVRPVGLARPGDVVRGKAARGRAV